MIGYPEAPKAWWLTRGMARISGLNLARAVLDGWLPRAEVEILVTRCAACALGRDCETLLAKAQLPAEMPESCPNRKAIQALGS